MKKVGMILDGHYPPDVRVENEALVLIEQGWEVHLLCLQYGKDLPQEEVRKGIKVHRISCHPLIRKISALAYTLPIYHWFLVKHIKRFIATFDIDIIHTHDLQIARAVFWANKQTRKKHVLDFHENRPEIMKFYKHVNSLMGRLLIYPSVWKRFEFLYARLTDYLVVVTEQAKQYYVDSAKIDADKIVVVPNTVSESFYKHSKIEHQIANKYKEYYTLLYLGDTGKRRGLETVINALVALRKTIPNIKLVIVGKSTYDPELKSLIRDLKLEDQVDHLGWQSVELFPSFIKACKLGLCPIHKNLHHETTYANKVFQTLSMGKPMIVSDCLAQQKVIEDYQCGLVFKDQDVEDFKDKIMEIYQDKNLYEQMSKNALDCIDSDFKWEVKSQELVSLYEQIKLAQPGG